MNHPLTPLPSQFEWIFDFQGDIVLQGHINGLPCSRIVLDTGAAQHVLVLPPDSPLLKPSPVETVMLSIQDICFGPIAVRTKTHKPDRPGEFALYLGMPQLQGYTLYLDYSKSVVHFRQKGHLKQGHPLSLGNGRLIIPIHMGSQTLRCILDTGSNANWLFHHRQTQEVLSQGTIQHTEKEIGTGFGAIQLKNTFQAQVDLAGQAPSLTFLMANAHDFGGMTAEDGIIGTGYLASEYPYQIIDLHQMLFQLSSQPFVPA